MTGKKGIVDPWRVTDAAVPPPARAPTGPRARVDLDDLALHADVRVASGHVFRSELGSVEVKSSRVHGSNDALRDLIGCLFEILARPEGAGLLEDTGIGFLLGDRHGGAVQGRSCSSLTTENGDAPAAQLYFNNLPIAQGMARLVRLLHAARRRLGAAGEDTLKRWGVTPLLR